LNRRQSLAENRVAPQRAASDTIIERGGAASGASRAAFFREAPHS
jgi:hypothetical protein